MIPAHCTNAATKPDTLYSVLWKKKKKRKSWVIPYWKKPRTNKPLAEHIFLFLCQLAEKAKSCLWLPYGGKRLLDPFFFLFFFFFLLNSPSAEWSQGVLHAPNTDLTKRSNTNSLSKPSAESLLFLLPHTRIQTHLPRISFSCCSLSSLKVRYACQM